MLKQIKDTPTRLSLLGNYLEGIKATVFRQTQFAEFELRMHEMAREAASRSPATRWRSCIWTSPAGTTATTRGICIVDDYIAHEWSFIPHFYRDFYVFQYATSFTAAEALSAKVLAGDQAATQALSDVPRGRRVEVSDRPAEGRRRGHDHRRAARPDDPEDERGDGRDGEAARR